MKITQLKTEPRQKLGSANSRRYRRDGRLPGVVYGLGSAPVSFTVCEEEFEHELHAGHRAFKLEIGGKEEAALLQDIQYDALGEYLIHVDFKRVDLTKKVRVNVALAFVGMPAIAANGVVDHVSEDVEVECLPADIPASIEVSISGLELGAHIEAKDVKLPAGLTLVTDPHRVLVSHHFKAVEAAPAAAEGETAQPEMTKEKKDADAKPAAGAEKKDAKK
jgi:large subunit ribosomal protein L25